MCRCPALQFIFYFESWLLLTLLRASPLKAQWATSKNVKKLCAAKRSNNFCTWETSKILIGTLGRKVFITLAWPIMRFTFGKEVPMRLVCF